MWSPHGAFEKELPPHNGPSYWLDDKDERSLCRVTLAPEGVYLDFKYKEDGINPRNVFLDNATVIEVVAELSKRDIRFDVNGTTPYFLLLLLTDVDRTYRKEINSITKDAFTYPPKLEYHELGYKIGERGRILSVDGFHIAGDKHAYVCRKCGAVFQSKNAKVRSVFKTDDPRCQSCEHGDGDLEIVCECKPSVTWDFNKEGVFVPTEVEEEDRASFQEGLR